MDRSVVKTRIVTAALLFFPVAAVLLWGGLPLKLLGIVLFLAINFEYYAAFVSPILKRQLILTAISALLIFGYLTFGTTGLTIAFPSAVVLAFVFMIITVETEVHMHDFQQSLPAVFVGLCYPGVLGSLLVIAACEFSGRQILWLLLTVAFTDSCAYFGGSAIGGAKLAARVSPKKTVSGTLCGLCGGIAGGLLAASILSLDNHPLQVALCAFAAGVLAVFGDLSESLLKRVYGLKDTGNILPGHGGLLDRVDALLFALPVLFIMK